jgi:penicillin-binding protein 1A
LREPAGTLTEYFLEEQLPPEADDKVEKVDKVDGHLKSVEDIINEFLSP